MSQAVFTEALESRVFLSASIDSVLSAAVKTDQLQIQADLMKFRGDCLAASNTMLSDILRIKSAAPKQAGRVAPLVSRMRSDLNSMARQLLADRLTEAQNVLADESTIATDKLKALKDAGTPTATADHAKLLADRIKLQNDMISGLNSRIATRQADSAAIFSDSQAIVMAVQADGNPAINVGQWASDRSACMDTFTIDLRTLAADRTQLTADLTATQST